MLGGGGFGKIITIALLLPKSMLWESPEYVNLTV